MVRWSVFTLTLLAFICVPFALLEDEMGALVRSTLQSKTSLALVTLAVIGFLLADIVLPIPSSFVLTTTGFLLGFGTGAVVGFIGLTCASVAGWIIGRHGGGPLAQRIVGEARLERFSVLSRRHGDVLLAALRGVPVLAEATCIVAGIARMPLAHFTLVVSVGNAVLAALYAWLGAASASQGSLVIAFVASMALPALLILAARRAARGAAH